MKRYEAFDPSEKNYFRVEDSVNFLKGAVIAENRIIN